KGLTDDEKAIYVAIAGEGMSYSKVADMLNIKKGTVQSYMKRAQKKIANNIENGSQLSLFVS
ncbi:MAG: sigma factor-like helix-turn-helix DNA-binding protein, partial [Lysinibacillus sp.]